MTRDSDSLSKNCPNESFETSHDSWLVSSLKATQFWLKGGPEEHGGAGVQLGAVLAVELAGGGAVGEAALLAAGAGVHLHLLAPLAFAL